MEWYVTVITSAVISVFVAYATAKAASYSKDVVEERKEWRDKIRKITLEAERLIQDKKTQSQEFQTLVSEFRLRLNPDDMSDIEIIQTLEESKQKPTELLARKLVAQVSRLLKHDWERAKNEARLFGFSKPNEKEIRTLRSADYLD